jgi:cytidylate kinase
MIIAIDGPAGAGKSTVARFLAKELGFVYLDTGAIYRALTLKALDKNINLKDTAGVVRMCKNTQLDISNNQDGSILILLDGENVSRRIRSPQVTQYVSEVAKIKGVREEMLKLQRSSAAKDNSVVDGRDIGTVVFPDAEKKFYLDAEFDQRLRRRFKELKATGRQVTKEAVEANLKNRDYIDSTREFAPLRKADDAVYIDTTNMTVNEAVQTILEKITGGVNNQ